MSNRFQDAASAARSLASSAQRSRNWAAAKEASAISRIANGLARLERSFEAQSRQLTAALSQLRNAIKTQPKGKAGRQGELPGYYVNIAAGRNRPHRGGGRPADTGLVGRRVGRGPVRMTSSGAQSAKAMTAAFAKLLAAQSQLQQLRVELESLKERR